ncbi:hypothetical protein QBC45DRAFT_22523 [Copromyces sp. CBS 386.78]|nr:hypothetical protein QBC45DRAFT_22523 [Copromyces sp. CBS 386.78]
MERSGGTLAETSIQNSNRLRRHTHTPVYLDIGLTLPRLHPPSPGGPAGILSRSYLPTLLTLPNRIRPDDLCRLPLASCDAGHASRFHPSSSPGLLPSRPHIRYLPYLRITSLLSSPFLTPSFSIGPRSSCLVRLSSVSSVVCPPPPFVCETTVDVDVDSQLGITVIPTVTSTYYTKSTRNPYSIRYLTPLSLAARRIPLLPTPFLLLPFACWHFGSLESGGIGTIAEPATHLPHFEERVRLTLSFPRGVPARPRE